MNGQNRFALRSLELRDQSLIDQRVSYYRFSIMQFTIGFVDSTPVTRTFSLVVYV